MLLEQINSLHDLKQMPVTSLPDLANEIRESLIKKASIYGGHLGSNLGAVELTIALHYVFDSPTDKIIFDVSHQSYTHKLLTGRKDAYLNPDLYNTVTGFTNPSESIHDAFNIGHTSTSISLASGLAKGRDLRGGNEDIIAVIGDAALDGGEAFEALNYVGEQKPAGLIVVINDNDMSIPENHGALNKLLNKLRDQNGSVEDNYFKALGYHYLFVRDGHSITSLINTFRMVKGTDHPVIVHCCTQKGRGYPFAETYKEKWHHAHPFNIETGEFLPATSVPAENYGAIVGNYLMDKIKKDSRMVVMTASVPACFGFNAEKRKAAGGQFIDVGIAEQHLISMATGLAKAGCKPVTITESSFYQRAYDQIEQEMCINQCAVTMLVAFSGIYAHNDNTHIGFYDISLFGNIPGLVYLAPSNKQEYLSMLEWSVEQDKQPVAIRIPWNGVHNTDELVPDNYSETKYWVRKQGTKIALLGLGSFYQLSEEVANQINEKLGFQPTLIDPMFATGVDSETLEQLKEHHEIVVTLEDGIVSGGFGARIAQYYGSSSMRVLNCGFSMEVPVMFTAKEMLQKNRLTPELIIEDIEALL